MNPVGIGAAIRRLEDRRFLTGHAAYVADVVVPGALSAAIVRSPHAHARLRGIDPGAAARAPGVVAVLTAADMAADEVGPMRPLWAVRSRDGRPMAEPPRWSLARERVSHVGEPVAVVIAESPATAADVVELAGVDYEALPAVVGSREALADGAPRLHQEAPGNVAFHWARGDEAAVRRRSPARRTSPGSTS